MSKAQCPELSRLPLFLELEDLLPKDFLIHARTCADCLLWTSYSLAIKEAALTTDRDFMIECPHPELFLKLLIGSLKGLWVDNIEKMNKNIFHFTTEEWAELWPIVEHINGDSPLCCEYCRDYYHRLYDAALKFQEQYEYRIRRGEDVKPPTEYGAQHRQITQPSGNVLRKPN
jgi:hypothetical protein